MPRHQTLFKEVKVGVKKILKQESVKKIIVGPYENCRHAYPPGTILIKQATTTGFKLAGYDGSGVVTLYLYLKEEKNREKVELYLNKFTKKSK